MQLPVACNPSRGAHEGAYLDGKHVLRLYSTGKNSTYYESSAFRPMSCVSKSICMEIEILSSTSYCIEDTFNVNQM